MGLFGIWGVPACAALAGSALSEKLGAGRRDKKGDDVNAISLFCGGESCPYVWASAMWRGFYALHLPSPGVPNAFQTDLQMELNALVEKLGQACVF